MSKATAWVMVLALLGGTIGCSGGSRFGGTFFEETTPDGIWNSNSSSLIRSYDIDLKTAYEAIEKFIKAEKLAVEEQSSKARTATFDTKTESGIEIRFNVWAPSGKATDIGIKYSKGDRVQSVRLFDQLEKLLPSGKRVKGNQ